MPTTQVLLLLLLFARLMPRFSEMMQSYHGFINLIPAFISVMEMEKRCNTEAESPPQNGERLVLGDAIRLERVSFGYDGREVIHDIDLTIRAGETAAIIGPSGSGKSTVADLLIRLITPHKGRVSVDGVTLSPGNLKSWREQIGYVTQDTFLFHDTVRANLLFACPDAKEEDIYWVLELAAADEFVSRLPRGIDTVVGDRGMWLSGGERQRLALARALMRKPSLLVLDEATNSLDPENERHILEALKQLHGLVTILIISHRLSAVEWADKIYLLEEGHVVESGSWDELKLDKVKVSPI